MTHVDPELRKVAAKGIQRKQVEAERVANLVGKSLSQTAEATNFISNVSARAQADEQGVVQVAQMKNMM